MNRDDIIDLALAGKQNLRDRISYAIDLEREACAKVCEEIASSGENNDRWTITRDIAFNNCAFAIRERGAP